MRGCTPSSAPESLEYSALSLLSLFLYSCRGDLDLSRLNLVKTLGLWRGLPERLCLLGDIVLDSEYADSYALFLIVLFAELFEIYSGCSARGALGGLFVLSCRIPHMRHGMARGRLFVIAHVAGVGLLSGKGPRVIMSVDVSILPQSVFVRGGATGAAFKEMDLNAFIRTADPRKVRIVERARTEDERPIVTVAKHRTITLLPTSVPRPSRELSASIEREFIEDAGGSSGGDQEVASVVVWEVNHRAHTITLLRADYGTTGGSAAGGKSPSVLNRLLQASRLTVEQGVPALPTLPFITSSVTASPYEEAREHTDSVTGPSLPNCLRSVMTKATTADRTLSLFTRRPGSDFVAGSIRAGGDTDADLQEIYVPKCLSSEVRMRAEYNILEKKKWKSLAEEKNNLLQGRIGDFRSLRASGSLRGEVAYAKEHNGLLEQERSALKLKVTSPESIIAEKYREISDLGTTSLL
ncbi:hypothetical protein Tco_0190999 [Tanacetum coccineum]